MEHCKIRGRKENGRLARNDVPSRLDKDGKEQKKKAFNMAKRFRANGKAYFDFITTPGIGPTNNRAEQAVRFVVIDRLITQSTRNLKGRETCERLWTVVGNLRFTRPICLRIYPHGRPSLFPERTRPLPVPRLGLIRPAPKRWGRRAALLIHGSSKRID